MSRHCFLFIGLIALCITSCSRTPEYTDSAARLAGRIVPSHSDDFIFTLVPAEKDFFELRQNGDKIEIQGNNGISMARGLNHYLRHYCHASVSWCGDNLASIPDTLPAVGEPVHIEASQPLRYYLNYCTYSYSIARRVSLSFAGGGAAVRVRHQSPLLLPFVRQSPADGVP